ncbi:WXG100 family type VII secretion target [Amycolatopsis sp. NPDC098790]|uniref:WXG100 family type VII secretion target n=1 Tax=Amycolatopsis sp. NPDC098790 TaxID=3363939 RepID=UPI003824A71C
MKQPTGLPTISVASGAHSISVIVDGDPSQLHVTATWFSTLAHAEATLADDLTTSARQAESSWQGAAGEIFHHTLTRQRNHADQLHHVANDYSTAVHAFADEITAVKNAIAEAKDLARRTGARVTDTAIQFPILLADPAHSGPSAAVTALVSAARQREQAAHHALAAALKEHQTFLDTLFSKTRPYSVGKSIFTLSTGTKSYFDEVANRTQSMRAAAFIADNSHGGMRSAAYDHLFTTAPAVAADDATRAVRAPLTYGLGNYVKPASAAMGSLAGSVSVSNGALVAVGVGLDVASGTPPLKAGVKGGASFAASSLAMAGLVALGVGTGPVGIAVLIVAGSIAGAGTGYAIDQVWK